MKQLQVAGFSLKEFVAADDNFKTATQQQPLRQMEDYTVQVLFSNQASFSQVRQETLATNGASDNRETRNRAAQATDQLVNRLAENVPGLNASELRGLNAESFSPENVASRISGFVAQGLESARARGATDAELGRLYDAAVEGIERGFNEATDILNELDILSPEIQDIIDTTFDLTFEALAGLAPNSSETAPSRQVSLTAAERFSRSESFSLDVTTQDGDTVSIRFQNQQSETASLGAFSDGENSAVAFSLERNASSNFSFSIEGDLDDEEIEALQNLIQDVNLIAEDFFNGDVQEAFQQAAEFELDRTELANLNLTLSQSSSVSAVTAYEEVQQLENPLGNGGRQLGQLFNNTEQVFGNPALGFLEDSNLFGARLLDQLVQEDIRYQDADEEQQSLFDGNLALLDDVIAQFNRDDA